VELHCGVCGANCRNGSLKWFQGSDGLWKHIKTFHKEVVKEGAGLRGYDRE
jgi:hypothetical protein